MRQDRKLPIVFVSDSLIIKAAAIARLLGFSADRVIDLFDFALGY